jgi:thiol-disulfide isomerase/thioredoxin
VIVWVARIALVVVFSFGALAKLADRPGSRDALAAFGVPERAAGPLGWLLVAVELGIAAAVLADPIQIGGAIAALGLLAIVSTAVVANLIGGRTPECHCFGALSRGPIGASTLARNGMLASVAGYVAAGGHETVVFAGLAGVCGAAWLAFGRFPRRLRRGGEVPEFSLSDAAGETWTVQRLLSRNRPVLLVFSQPACGACQALVPDLERWRAELGHRLTIALIDQAPAGSVSPGRPTYPVLHDPEGDAVSAYGVTATPSAALIESSGQIASPLAQGAGEIASLVETRFEPDDAPRLPRRTVIAQAARGAATLGAFPLLAAACGSSKSSTGVPSTPSTATSATRPKSVRVGSAYICQQKYALCTNAACVPSPHDPNVVICDCVVKEGYSVGLFTCPRRAPHGNTLYSEFSTELVTSSVRAMTCGANVPWANCVDAICELDPRNPTKAKCQCPVVKQGPSFTFGGSCHTETCGKVVWSGAHNNLGSKQVAAAMKRLGQPLKTPAPCPKA